MKYSAYPRYRESGVEWLGAVPEHWEVSRFSRSVRIAEGQVNPEMEPYSGMLLIAPNHVEPGTGRLVFRETAFEQGAGSGKYICKKGDVVYSKIRPALAKVVLSPENCICSADMYPLRGAHNLENEFIFWTLLSQWFTAWSVLEADRVAMPKINRETLGGCQLCVPPLCEQRVIATFLDMQTARIDALIVKKRELIDRLAEKRVALISRTVTRGLPPEAAMEVGLAPYPAMKDSGVEWLGAVPVHWDVAPFSRAAKSIQTGPFGSLLHQADYVEDGVPIINPAHITGGRLLSDGVSTVSKETFLRLERYKIKKGDLVFSRRGDVSRCGVATVENEGWLCGTGSMVVRLIEGVPEYFVNLCMYSGFAQQLELHAVGTTMKNTNPTIIGRIVAPLPPAKEQQAIADYLDRETARLDVLMARVESAITRLQEYRAALITAAVTGKIDVREAAR